MLATVLNFIRWTVDPILFELGPLKVGWYGLLFASAFAVGYIIMRYVYRREGLSDDELDKLSLTMILSVVIGARLGHVLFYQPDYYLENPLKILAVWEGGLASHGGAIGILIGLFIYARRPAVPSYMWILDRIMLTVPTGAFFIRMGNLMNSEIYGLPSDLPWAFLFLNGEDCTRPELIMMGNCVPRHPTQLYEGLFYLALFFLIFGVYRRYGRNLPPGRLLGLLLVLVFMWRFLVEFVKENQVAFEDTLPLNMGQWLSIPFVLVGALILVRSFRVGPKAEI